jgi:hypothetical protein
MRMAASSPVWFTRRAEERKERCSGESSWMGFEVEGGEEETVALLVGNERLEEAALEGVGACGLAAVLWVRRWRGESEREVCGVVVRDVMVSGARKSRTCGVLRGRALGVSSRAAIVCYSVCYCGVVLYCTGEGEVEVTATAGLVISPHLKSGPTRVFPDALETPRQPSSSSFPRLSGLQHLSSTPLTLRPSPFHSPSPAQHLSWRFESCRLPAFSPRFHYISFQHV